LQQVLKHIQEKGQTMPLLYIDLIEGRTPSEVTALLDAIHDAVVDAFAVPPRDRYQVVHSHPAHEIVAWDTGLGIERSSRLVVVHVVSRRRTREMKEKFYELLASNLAERCGVDPADLIVSITENGDEDWSFGHGRAQFLTGELK
jgi:phenylpyruvate tautomerase PptA (4-oxalocrotonate tautomerase family)